jgi:cell division protein FtsB
MDLAKVITEMSNEDYERELARLRAENERLKLELAGLRSDIAAGVLSYAAAPSQEE